MGRRLRTTVPCAGASLHPGGVDGQHHRDAVAARRRKSKADFDRRHRARELRPLKPGELVWVRDRRAHAMVRRDEPRSYDVAFDDGAVPRRNRAFLVPVTRRAGRYEEAADLDADDIAVPRPQPAPQGGDAEAQPGPVRAPGPEVYDGPVPEAAPRRARSAQLSSNRRGAASEPPEASHQNA